ncbi:hypothetical protein HDU97_000183 [Phlyctochytrium planicorne]|nr:hypothetical protein HDU97_000183 [Phlyctochytrium planicorne]
MSLNMLSISDFTDSGVDANVSSANIGVVEIMLLVLCDKVIYQKIKWMLAMDMAAAAAKQLQVVHPTTESYVILETEDGNQSTFITDYSGFDKSVDDIEKNLLRQVTVLHQTLRRYNLAEGKPNELCGYLNTAELHGFYPNLDFQDQIPWKLISFSNLRKKLVDLFSKQTGTTPLIRKIPSKCLSVQSIQMPSQMEKSKSLLKKPQIQINSNKAKEEDASPLAHVFSHTLKKGI